MNIMLQYVVIPKNGRVNYTVSQKNFPLCHCAYLC